MAKIILEDMKLNKGRRSVAPKREKEVFSPQPIIENNSYKIELEQEKIKQEIKQIEQEQEQESQKIEEYIKERKKSSQRLQRTPKIKGQHKILHKPVIIIFILSLVIGGIYWGGNFFQKANVNITSKHQIINYTNKQFTAGKNEDNNNVNFEIMITSNKKPINIVLTEPKDVSLKAKGSVILYNEFSTKSEKLSAGTFISDNTGKAYKIDNTISIPGYKLDTKKKIIPGQISVNITSFLVGDAYNGSPTDFHITSFKGTTKYNKIYGKLKSPLVGGASGVFYTLNDTDKKNLDNTANTSFKEDLLKQVKTLIPPGYIIYPGALNFSYSGIDNILSKTPETSIDINGTLAIVLLKEKSLINNIIKTSLPNIKDDELKEITILDLDKLSFNFTNANQLITKDMDSVSFFLSGNIDAVWNPNIDILKTKLLGIYKNDVLSVFRQDSGISRASVDIFPPWQKSLPDDPLKININIK